MSDLVVVANRGPANLSLADDGTLRAGHGAGGLAPSLARALTGRGAQWVAAAMNDAERRVAAQPHLADDLLPGIALDFVPLAPEVAAAAYNVVANQTLWFVHHGMFDHVYRPVFDRRWREAWAAYVAYNAAFAERIADRAGEHAVVVVHDYHLALLGAQLGARRPDLRTVHFTHTPFATPSELGVLPAPARRELLEGMAAFGALGFHASRWRDRFEQAATEHAIVPGERFVAPLGSDPEDLRATAASPAVGAAKDALLARTDGRTLVVRSDRVEPSKNIVRGFLAFAELLERRPELAPRTRFVARTYASRTGLLEYLAYRAEVERVAEQVNRHFRARAGGDVIELAVEDDFPASLAALALADVLVVNPIRDGMNLVAKEGPIVNEVAGSLCLSTETGAFAELGDASFAVEPFDVSGTSAALEAAIDAGPGERRRRAEVLVARASAWPPGRWLDALIAEARESPAGSS